MIKKVLYYGHCSLPLAGFLLCLILGRISPTGGVVYTLGTFGFVFFFVVQLVTPIWATKKPEQKWAAGIFGSVILSFVPFFLLFNAFLPIDVAFQTLWVTIFFGVIDLLEIAYFVFELMQKEWNRACLTGATLLFLFLILFGTVTPFFCSEYTQALRIANMVINFVAVGVHLGIVATLFFRNKGIHLVARIIAWCKKRHFGLFITSSYAIYMGIASIIFCAKNNVWRTCWSLPLFFFTLAAVRIWSLIYDSRCRKTIKDPDDLLQHRYIILIVGAAAILTLGGYYGSALSSYGSMKNIGHVFSWFSISSAIFVTFRSIFGIRSLILSGKNKDPFRYVNNACDILNILFCIFQVVELILLAIKWQNAIAEVIVIYIAYAFVVSSSFFVLIRMLITGIKGVNKYSKIVQDKKAKQEASSEEKQQ